MLKDMNLALGSLTRLPWLLGWAAITVLGPLMAAKVFCQSIRLILSQIFDLEKGFQNKIILITGASSGLGEALAHVLYKRGCKLILASRNTEKLMKLKTTLLENYKPPILHVPHVIKLDLEELNSIPNVIKNAIKVNGHIDVVINNAGMTYRGQSYDTELCVDVRLMMVNYFGHVAVTKAVLPTMKERKQGQIISISSVQGKMAIPYRSCYTASKHALQAFMDSLRSEVALDNIDVTVISPSYIKTSLSNNALTASGKVYGKTDKTTSEGYPPEYIAERVAKTIITKEKDVCLCPSTHKAAIYLRTISPDLYFYIMKLRANSKQKNI